MKKIALGLCVLITLGTGSLFADPCKDLGGKFFGFQMSLSGDDNWDMRRCNSMCQYSNRRVKDNVSIIEANGTTYCCCQER
ncbi:hypothetical protein IKO70_07710 [bacterium]|nr:hypothetical protein [bacterium]